MPVYDGSKWEWKPVRDMYLDEQGVEQWKTAFYKLEGWDPKTGYPVRKTLEDLGMKHVADVLQAKKQAGNSLTNLFNRRDAMRSMLMVPAAFVLCAAAVLIGNVAPWANAGVGPIPLNCNRACLENVVEQYLTALVAHDPKRVPLSKDVKYTENAQLMELGDGFWKTAEGRGNYTHIFADPEFGQVSYMGTMREAGAPLLMSLRLRIELGRITEIESVFFKPGGGGPNNIADMDKPYKPEDIRFKSIPPAQQMSRQELIAVADAYFTGLAGKMTGRGLTARALIRSLLTVTGSRTALQRPTFRGRPIRLPMLSIPSGWIACRSSNWGPTT